MANGSKSKYNSGFKQINLIKKAYVIPHINYNDYEQIKWVI